MGSKQKHPIFGRGLKYEVLREIERLANKKLQKASKMEQEEEKRGVPGRIKNKPKESWPKMLKSLQNSNLGYGFQLSSTDLYLHSRMET